MEPIFILVRPQMGENIGAAARAMLNFGIKGLRIVNPRDGWPNSRAKALASGAGSILDNVIIFDTVKESCQDLNYVFASSARERKLDKEELPLGEVMPACMNLIDEGSKVGFLFGPEKSGLMNEDVAFADKIVYLETSKDFRSINLAQCVMLFAYEWFQSKTEAPVQIQRKSQHPLASKEELDELTKRLKFNLEKKGYFWPKDKEKSLKLYIDNLFSKLPLNSSDIRFLHGIIRAFQEKK